jgi:hypothetical protein
MRVLIMLRPGRPPRRPTDVDSRRFPGLLKLNLDVRIARYARFAAAANAPDRRKQSCESSAYNSRTKPVNLKR